MELRHLRYFVEAARELHFARAAETLHITQPALSRQIAALETELKVRLFSRENKWKLALTPAGEVFFAEAERLLKQSEHAAMMAKLACRCGGGKLVIGAISSTIGNPAFPQALLEMRRRFPDLGIELIDGSSAALSEQLAKRKLDIAFFRPQPKLDPEDKLIYEQLGEDELTLALPIGHPLCRKKRLEPSMLAEESFILVPERTSGALRNYLALYFRTRGGFTPKVTFEICSTYSALRMAAAGFGVTVAAASYMGTFPEGVCYRRFGENPPKIPLIAARPAEKSTRSAEVFLEILRTLWSRSQQ